MALNQLVFNGALSITVHASLACTHCQAGNSVRGGLKCRVSTMQFFISKFVKTIWQFSIPPK